MKKIPSLNDEWDARINDWGIEEEIEFVDKDLMENELESTDDKLIRLYNQKTMQVIKHIDEFGLPSKNEQLRLITKRSFNAVAFMQKISQTEKIIDCYMVVYSINYEAALIINKLVESGTIQEATIMISNLRNQAYRKKEESVKQFFINNKNIELIFAPSHAKIISFKTDKDNHYTIEGSGNLSFNSRIEQYIIDNDKKLYEFTEQWINEIKEYYKTSKSFVVYPKNK